MTKRFAISVRFPTSNRITQRHPQASCGAADGHRLRHAVEEIVGRALRGAVGGAHAEIATNGHSGSSPDEESLENNLSASPMAPLMRKKSTSYNINHGPNQQAASIGTTGDDEFISEGRAGKRPLPSHLPYNEAGRELRAARRSQRLWRRSSGVPAS